MRKLVTIIIVILLSVKAYGTEVEFIGAPERWNPVSTVYTQKIIVSGKNISVIVNCGNGQIGIEPQKLFEPNKLPYGEKVFNKVCGKLSDLKNNGQGTEANIQGAIQPRPKKTDQAQPVLGDIYRYRDAEGVLHVSNLSGAKLNKSDPTPTSEQLIKSENSRLKKVAKKMELTIKSTYSKKQFQTKCYVKSEKGENGIICSLSFPANYPAGADVPMRYVHNIQALTREIAVAFASNKSPESFWIQSKLKMHGDNDYTPICNFIYSKEFDKLDYDPCGLY